MGWGLPNPPPVDRCAKLIVVVWRREIGRTTLFDFLLIYFIAAFAAARNLNSVLHLPWKVECRVGQKFKFYGLKCALPVLWLFTLCSSIDFFNKANLKPGVIPIWHILKFGNFRNFYDTWWWTWRVANWNCWMNLAYLSAIEACHILTIKINKFKNLTQSVAIDKLPESQHHVGSTYRYHTVI